MLIGLFIYSVTAILFIFSKNVLTLILLRLVQGFTSAMILPVAQAYLAMITPHRMEGRIMGFFNVSLYAGLSVGPLIGGFLSDLFNIQVSFLCMGIFALAGFLLCLIWLPTTEASHKGHEMSNKSVVQTLKICLVDDSILSIFIFRICFTSCIGMIWTYLPVIAKNSFNLSSSEIGILVMLNVLAIGLFQGIMGFSADRFNKKYLVIFGSALAVLAFIYFSLASTFFDLLLASGLFGLGAGIAIPAIMALAVIEGRNKKAMGTIMGFLSLGHSIGMLIGSTFSGILITFFSFRTIYISGGIVIIIGTLIFILQQKLFQSPTNTIENSECMKLQ
ncbi:MAG: MFS transporter [Pseudomonadota bacterium]